MTRTYSHKSRHRVGCSRQLSAVRCRRLWLNRRSAATEGPSLSCASRPRSASCDTSASASSRGCCAVRPARRTFSLRVPHQDARTYVGLCQCWSSRDRVCRSMLTWAWPTSLYRRGDAHGLQPGSLYTALQVHSHGWCCSRRISMGGVAGTARRSGARAIVAASTPAGSTPHTGTTALARNS